MRLDLTFRFGFKLILDEANIKREFLGTKRVFVFVTLFDKVSVRNQIVDHLDDEIDYSRTALLRIDQLEENIEHILAFERI